MGFKRDLKNYPKDCFFSPLHCNSFHLDNSFMNHIPGVLTKEIELHMRWVSVYQESLQEHIQSTYETFKQMISDFFYFEKDVV